MPEVFLTQPPLPEVGARAARRTFSVCLSLLLRSPHAPHSESGGGEDERKRGGGRPLLLPCLPAPEAAAAAAAAVAAAAAAAAAAAIGKKRGGDQFDKKTSVRSGVTAC